MCEEVRVQEADPHIAGQVGASSGPRNARAEEAGLPQTWCGRRGCPRAHRRAATEEFSHRDQRSVASNPCACLDRFGVNPFIIYGPNLQLRRADLALRRLGGLTKTRLCCAANPKLDPGPQVCPRRCLRAGETHSANGTNLPGAAYPYKRSFDTAAAGRPKDDETYYLGVRVELG